jgi:hypothetical protein
VGCGDERGGIPLLGRTWAIWGSCPSELFARMGSAYGIIELDTEHRPICKRPALRALISQCPSFAAEGCAPLPNFSFLAPSTGLGINRARMSSAFPEAGVALSHIDPKSHGIPRRGASPEPRCWAGPIQAREPKGSTAPLFLRLPGLRQDLFEGRASPTTPVEPCDPPTPSVMEYASLELTNEI